MIPADMFAMAENVMEAHGLIPSWRFRLDGAKRRFGQCDESLRLITMSRHMVAVNTPEECRITLLHEVAHALAGAADGHGSIWASKCRELGIKPMRCYNDEGRNVVTPKPNFYEVCPNCQRAYPRFRKTRTANACGQCCNKYNGGKFDSRFSLVNSVDGKIDAIKLLKELL